MKISLRDKKISPWDIILFLRDKNISPWNILLFLGDKNNISVECENTELYHVVQERAEGPKAPSPGQRPGYNSIFSKAPCKGKSFTNRLVLKLLPLQGDRFAAIKNPGRCPGLGASALYLSLRPVTVGSGRMGKTGFLKLCVKRVGV